MGSPTLASWTVGRKPAHLTVGRKPAHLTVGRKPAHLTVGRKPAHLTVGRKPAHKTAAWSAAALTLAAGCGNRTATPDGDRIASIDPNVCAGCHHGHWVDWAGSMHAAAADDPIFIAMNARGQRETGGALGAFCVRCHAPLAVSRGRTTDGLNLGALPAELRGVTCSVCHTASVSDAATVDAGQSLQLADDGVMRGPIADPVASPAHASVYSPFHDRQRAESADLCGGCHAVRNGHGLEVERTIDEWRETAYAREPTLRTCGRCHMPETAGAAADVPLAPPRRVHGHEMPGVDLGAASAAQRKGVDQELGPAISSRLCVVPGPSGAAVTVTVDNALVGHAWPSGATQDRRAWLELVAYAGGAVVYTSGVVGSAEAVTDAPDPPLLLLRQELFDDGGPTPFMWNARTSRSSLLAPATADPAQATATATVQIEGSVDRVTSRVLLRPIDNDVAGVLVASGDLSPAVASALPTLAVRATVLEWQADRGAACLP